MSRLNLILLPTLLILATPGWADTRPANPKTSQTRPLNLSLPNEVLRAPDQVQTDDAVQRNLSAPVPTAEAAKRRNPPGSLPYGAGYEHRHQEMGAGVSPGNGTGAGGGAGAGGGRRGR